MANYCWVYGVIHFTSPAGWLSVHWDQLRAQRSVTSMGKLYLLPFYSQVQHNSWLFVCSLVLLIAHIAAWYTSDWLASKMEDAWCYKTSFCSGYFLSLLSTTALFVRAAEATGEWAGTEVALSSTGWDGWAATRRTVPGARQGSARRKCLRLGSERSCCADGINTFRFQSSTWQITGYSFSVLTLKNFQ